MADKISKLKASVGVKMAGGRKTSSAGARATPANFGQEKSPVRERMAKELKTKHHSQ